MSCPLFILSFSLLYLTRWRHLRIAQQGETYDLCIFGELNGEDEDQHDSWDEAGENEGRKQIKPRVRIDGAGIDSECPT